VANYTPSRLGVTDASTDGSFSQDNELFLKVFSQMVLTTFEETNVMGALHRQRNITSGKSAQFPVIGTTTAEYHSPGEEIKGNSIKHNERVINVDDKLIAHVFVDELDELKNHYEVRAEYASVLGRALALKQDKQLMQLVALAARASATVNGGNGGTQLTNANFKTDASTLAAGLFDAAQTLDEKDVPGENRYAALLPAQYYLLAQNTDVINRDWGGAGAFSDGTVLRVAGIQIVKSNNVPSTNVSATSGENNTYDGDFSTTAGIVWHESAVGTVNLMNLRMETDYQVQRQGTLMVAKFAKGHGILRPESSVELKTA